MREANSASVETPLQRRLFEISVVVWMATGVRGLRIRLSSPFCIVEEH